MAKDIGIRMEWSDDAVRIYRQNPADHPVLSVEMSAADQIEYALRHTPMTAAQIMDETGLKRDTVNKTLRRWRDRRFKQLGEDLWEAIVR